MELNNDNLEYYVQILTDNLSLVDNLKDEEVDILINYLENEILKKEKLLIELKGTLE